MIIHFHEGVREEILSIFPEPYFIDELSVLPEEGLWGFELSADDSEQKKFFFAMSESLWKNREKTHTVKAMHAVCGIKNLILLSVTLIFSSLRRLTLQVLFFHSRWILTFLFQSEYNCDEQFTTFFLKEDQGKREISHTFSRQMVILTFFSPKTVALHGCVVTW
ncbi:MAG: hypothetical protein ACPLVG_01155 [Pseudothermotoga sp.]